MSFSLQFESSYVWSKTMDRGEETVQSHYRMDQEKAAAIRDVPHRLAASYLYELPFGRGRRFGADVNRFTDLVIGGWQVNGITTIQSGTPVRITGTNTSGTPGGVTSTACSSAPPTQPSPTLPAAAWRARLMRPGNCSSA